MEKVTEFKPLFSGNETGEAEQDVQAGNVAPLGDTISDLRQKLMNGDFS